MIEVTGLTVRYGGVTSLDDMSLSFEQGTCGLIGPNGAGKTTFFNVLSGFVRPAAGTVRAFGADLLSMAHYRRARWGVRRTFQTEQAIEDLAILVDHDMSLVSACCATTAVLDFGKLIASGPTAAVLRNDDVIRAYLGVA
jgi:ABC-type branched-subunit amino acid transport system ATPase component